MTGIQLRPWTVLLHPHKKHAIDGRDRVLAARPGGGAEIRAYYALAPVLLRASTRAEPAGFAASLFQIHSSLRRACHMRPQRRRTQQICGHDGSPVRTLRADLSAAGTTSFAGRRGTAFTGGIDPSSRRWLDRPNRFRRRQRPAKYHLCALGLSPSQPRAAQAFCVSPLRVFPRSRPLKCIFRAETLGRPI